LWPGERLVQHRKVRDHDGKEPKAHAAFGNRQHSSDPSERMDVSQSEGEERRAAEVEIVGKMATAAARRLDIGTDGPQEHRKTKNERKRPYREQPHDRERAVYAKKPFAAALAADA